MSNSVKKTSLHESVAEILLTATEEEVEQFVPRSGNESSEAGTEELCKDPQTLQWMSIIRLWKHITNHIG